MIEVSDMSLGMMALTAVIVFVIPVILLFHYKKNGADVLPFFVGCAVFVIFALIIESAINYGVSQTDFGRRMMQNVPLLAVYGGLMAGIFEETGRFIAFKTVLRGKNGKDINALQYGAGHGGAEAILTVSFSYISYIALIALARSGGLANMVSGEELEQVTAVLKQFEDIEKWMFGVVILERLIAIAAHIALSVLVWFAAKNSEKLWLYPLAILLHAAMDFAAVLCQKQFMLPDIAVEGVVAGVACVIIIIAVRVWKKNSVGMWV